MKVLFLSNLFPDTREPYRGLDNATLLHELSKTYYIRVISPRPALPFRAVPERACRPVDEKFEPIYPRTFYVPKAGSLFNHHLFASAIRQPLLELKRKFPFDVILVSWTFPDTAAVAMLQSELGVPFVGIVQGSDAHAYLQLPLRKKTIVSALNRSAFTITRSAKLAQLLQGAGVAAEKLCPVYNGVDLELFQPVFDKKHAKLELGLSTQLPVLLFVGNFFPVKNPHLLVRAHAEVCRRFPQHRCQLVMVGGGPLEGEIRQLANQLGFGENVILAGRKVAVEVALHMKAADMLCMSSENEGVPNVILEAFASGLPVMSTAVGGIPEVVSSESLGRLVERGNLEAMTAAIARLLAEKPATEKIREHALRFSWENAATAYRTLLEKAAAK